MERITILQFTDPICVWCWGNEPVLRAIEYLYGDKVRIEFIMGGLVEDISTLYDFRGEKVDIIERANQIITKNWLIASQKHGMPVVDTGLKLFSERYPSSFPQNIAYEAAKRVNPLLAKRFLRLMREATFIHGRRTSQIDVILDLATQAGYNAAAFIDEYTTGNAHADFMQDRMKCRRNGITGFPSYLIKDGHTNIILGGYQNLATFHTVISRLSSGKIKPRRVGPSIANVMAFIKRYKRVYPAEIEVAFSLDKDRTNLMIAELILSRRIASQSVGEGRCLYLDTESKATKSEQKEPTSDKKPSKEKNSVKRKVTTTQTSQKQSVK